MKHEKKTIILTTLITLLPALIGFILWNKLPDQMPIHFNFGGQADNYSSKLFAVLGLPCIIMIFHLIVVFATMADPHNPQVSSKLNRLVLWICPLVSLFTAFLIYSAALGRNLDVNMITGIMMGLLFVIIGNYLPKTRHNYTIGIRIPTTLNSEENWEKTHRMAGPVWVAGGLIVLISAFLGTAGTIIMLITLCVISITPLVYSIRLAKKQKDL
ncbi:MAG: SdpI family protein [Lachnospiraceae bacterium]|nr:SdpI family protein [Lachnospiraceae bacterium]